MLLAAKIERTVIVLALLSTGMLAPAFPQSAAAPGAHPAVEVFVMKNEVTKMQETLRDKGHYSGKVDGVFGLRTRESIRSYQKAEKWPITGQVDNRTAAGLGVRPEASWENSEPGTSHGGDRVESEIREGKPSANIKWANGATRPNKRRGKPVKPVATSKRQAESGATTSQGASDSRTQ